jgi:hypothetical protein
MHTIHITREHMPDDEPPGCILQVSIDYLEAKTTWQFMVDNLRPDWVVTLLHETGAVLMEATSGDTKKLPGGRW